MAFRTAPFAVLVLLSIAAPRGQIRHPENLPIDGSVALRMASQATRTHLLGTAELYALALYLDDTAVDRAQLASRDTPKALRIQILHRDDPGERPTIDWRRELLPPLEPAATAHLRGAFAGLRHGHVITIAYIPSKGASLRVNESVVVTEASHDLMLAFLDHWLGQRPVSEEMKAALLR